MGLESEVCLEIKRKLCELQLNLWVACVLEFVSESEKNLPLQESCIRLLNVRTQTDRAVHSEYGFLEIDIYRKEVPRSHLCDGECRYLL